LFWEKVERLKLTAKRLKDEEKAERLKEIDKVERLKFAVAKFECWNERILNE